MRLIAALSLLVLLSGCATTGEDVGKFVGAAVVGGTMAAMGGNNDRDRERVIVVEHDRGWHRGWRWCRDYYGRPFRCRR